MNRVLYAVPWIEIEYGWGDRPEGFKVYDNLEDCIDDSRLKTGTGNYEGGYFGPVRPLHYYETVDDIQGEFPLFVNNLKFKSNSINI